VATDLVTYVQIRL